MKNNPVKLCFEGNAQVFCIFLYPVDADIDLPLYFTGNLGKFKSHNVCKEIMTQKLLVDPEQFFI